MDTKKKPVVPIVIGVLVVIAAAVAAFILLKPKVTVPDITQSFRSDAEQELTKVKLKIGTVTEEETAEIPIGDVVIRTDPAPGTSVDEGTEVNVVVSKGPKLNDPVEVPNILGLSPEDAENKLFDSFFIPQPGEPAYSDTAEAGKVIAQSVPAGTKVEMFSIIMYSVSLGKEQISVPDVTGKSISDARGMLDSAGLSCDTSQSYSDTVAKDVVISQSVAKDTKVDKGTTIVLEVSMGKKPATKVLVPNIITYKLADAKKSLDSAGLKYTYTGDENGTVTSVKPAPNTQVDQGSTVSFVLTAPKPVVKVAVPDITNMSLNDAKATLDNAGLRYTYSGDENGVVSSINPAPNTQVDQGSMVTFALVYNPAPEPEPEPGFKPNFSKDQCTQIALDAMGAGGQAKGEAANVSTSDLITGGGTIYYKVEFDLGDAHYEVQVDAISGGVIGASEVFGGIENLLDANGNVISSREL